ncbi:MAG: 50S ribosomal protein L17 [Gemmatimonadetes bacterium]|nr:50S ribosomal protein L17 [Gemmatimonadota bacterium]MYG85951.1 50S ribosomal protein L17 [Gemmatimonadota bacterium]MYJ89651.1 50S ribosomal protein L17 [Gemmatimonadota bacterium]
MRHRKQGRGLSRSPSHRKAMLSNLAASVLDTERVQTTTAKAKEVRRLVERLITFGKRRDLHARRQVLRVIHNESVVAKLFGPLADRYADRPGGYTRIVRIGHRQGDAADMSILELIDREGPGEDQADEKTEEKAEESKEETTEEEETG